MHFSHISAKIQLKNLKQHFDWGSWAPLGYALGFGTIFEVLHFWKRCFTHLSASKMNESFSCQFFT